MGSKCYGNLRSIRFIRRYWTIICCRLELCVYNILVRIWGALQVLLIFRNYYSSYNGLKRKEAFL